MSVLFPRTTCREHCVRFKGARHAGRMTEGRFSVRRGEFHMVSSQTPNNIALGKSSKLHARTLLQSFIFKSVVRGILFHYVGFIFVCTLPLSSFAQDSISSPIDTHSVPPELIFEKPSEELEQPLLSPFLPSGSGSVGSEAMSASEHPSSPEQIRQLSPPEFPSRLQNFSIPTSPKIARDEQIKMEGTKSLDMLPKPPVAPTTSRLHPKSSIVEESLEVSKSRVSLSPSERRSSVVELEATKVPQPQPIIGYENMDDLIIVLLVFLLLGNIFQFYRQRLHDNAMHNQMEAAFNNVAWLLARCMGKTKELSEREPVQKVENMTLFKEFREFSLNSEFTLRALHEQLVVVARNLKRRDRRWKLGQYGYSAEEMEKIRGTFVERSVGNI